MQKRPQLSYIYTVLIGFLLILPGNSLASQVQQAFDRSITILATPTLTEALNSIAHQFSTENNISVSVTFDSSNELADQIEQGEAANIFITDDKARLIDMQRLGLLNVFSLEDIASDTLVVVVPADSFLKRKLRNINNIDDKLHYLAKNVTIVIPDPETEIAGKAVMQTFSKVNEWDKVKSKMLRAANSRSALYLVSNGNNAGIVYNSDALSDPNVEVLFQIPQDYYDKITYQATIVAEPDSDSSSDYIEKLMKYIKSPEANKILTHYGFGSP